MALQLCGGETLRVLVSRNAQVMRASAPQPLKNKCPKFYYVSFELMLTTNWVTHRPPHYVHVPKFLLLIAPQDHH